MSDTDLSAGVLPYLRDSAMAARVRDFDWASTPLGRLEDWPRSLKAAVGICLNSRFPMFVWWGEHLINIYNDAYIPVLGGRHPRGLGCAAKELWGEIWPVIGPQADLVMKHGQATWNERVHLRMERNGFEEDTWFTWSYSPIPCEEGGIGGLFCACTEDTLEVRAEQERDRQVALRERAEQELDRQRRIHEAILTNTPDFAYVFDLDHRFIYANKVLLNTWGRTWQEAAGRNCLELGYADWHAAAHGREIDQVVATRQPIRGEIPFTGTNGRRIYDYIFVPVINAAGVVVAVAGTTRDVTERKQHEEALEESEARFRSMADDGPVMVWLTDAQGRCTYLSKSWYEFTGQTPETGLGSGWLDATHAEDHAAVEQAFAAANAAREAFKLEYRLRREDGEYRWVIDAASPRITSDGRFLGYVGSVFDITDRKLLEQARESLLESERAARSEAERAGRMKDEFLATLSHELRTPLNAVLGWAQILSKKPPSPETLEQGLSVIIRNARLQTQLIADLLDMSRIISGKMRLDVQPVEVGLAIELALDSARPAGEAKGIRIESDLAADAGLVQADPARLQQIVWNLVSNAVKFTPRDGVVRVTLKRVESHVEIAVRDTGKGISREFLPHAFGRFRQADSSAAREHGGLGLGLAIVKQLVELHGGSVGVDSPGLTKGATFTVTLPIAAVQPRTSRLEAAAKGRTSAPGMWELPDLAGVRVLVVDDEQDVRELVERILQECGAAVVVAATAAEGLVRLESGGVDVIVSDIGLPGADGYEFIRQVRERGIPTPAMAVTAFARAEDQTKALRAGYQTHLSKPVEPEELLSGVADLARRNAEK